MRQLTWMAALVTVAQLAGCGGKNGGTCSDIAGTWNSVEVENASRCGGGTTTERKTYAITQSGCDITVRTGSVSFPGRMDGSQASWSGTYSEGGGTVTIDSMTVTLASDLASASGTASWTWSGSGTSCGGTTQITATKSGSGGSGLDAGVAGFCAKFVSCNLSDASTCQSFAPTLLQGIVPDPTFFATCIQNLDCSQLTSQSAVQGCVNLSNGATVCNGSTLHACANTGPCVDVDCASACSALGHSLDHCGMDAAKGHDACFCE